MEQTTTEKRVTYRQLLQFRQGGFGFINNPQNLATKLGYYIKKALDKVNVQMMPYSEMENKRNDELNDTNIDYCEVDEKGRIVYDVVKGQHGEDIRQYVYTKEGMKNKNKKTSEIMMRYEKVLNEKLDEPVADFSPQFCSDVPEGLTPIDLDIFKGIVIAWDYEPKSIVKQLEPVK